MSRDLLRKVQWLLQNCVEDLKRCRWPLNQPEKRVITLLAGGFCAKHFSF
jgi:hypothetical protein